MLRFGGLTWLSASTSWFQNLSQKWMFSSPSQTNANLHKNLGPFRCVMSTFYNQISSWLTESGSSHFFLFYFYCWISRFAQKYETLCKIGCESGSMLVQLIQRAVIQIHFHLQVYRHHNIIIIYVHLKAINNVRLQLNILTDSNNWFITWRHQLNRDSERHTARASWWKWNKLS